MGKIRMYEPYGFQEGEAYYSIRNTIDDEIEYNRKIDKQQTEEAFAKVEYDSEMETVLFKNAVNEIVGQLPMTEIIASALVKDARYDSETQKLIIEFDNGDIVSIDLNDLINIQEAGNGLKLDGNKFSILIDPQSENFLQVSENGIKNVGIQDAINSERDRAISAETKETNDRIADVNEEEARAINAETILRQLINLEVQDRKNDVDDEENRAKGEELRIDNTLGTGFTTTATETVTYKFAELNQKLTDEISNRQTAIADEKRDRENADVLLDTKIENEILARVSEDSELDGKISGEKTRATNAETILQQNVDRNYSLIENISGNVYTKSESDNRYMPISSSTNQFATKEWVEEQNYLTEHQDISNLATKEELETFEDETNESISGVNASVYNLTKIIGDLGGAVTYNYPSEYGKSFNTLMGNNGTVKLLEDTTTGRFGPGITAKNKVTLNTNGKTLTISGLTTSSTQPGIMSRGTQEITIGGTGTLDAGQGVLIESNGADSVINLTGSSTTYKTDRSGVELVYCYSGTINIKGGVFKNNGSPYLLNCYDANYANGTAKIVVSGGKFYDFNPEDNTAEGEHTNFLAEGYHCEQSTVTEDGVEHIVYTVKKNT